MITKDDYDIYVLGSPYWAGVNDRILVSGVNDAEFWADFPEGKGGRGFKKNLDCPENRGTLILKYRQRFPTEPVIRTKLNELLWKLLISGNPDFIDPHEEPVDDRPRDAQGRLMSPKALQWREWENWVNDPEASMCLVEELRRTNPGFAEFYATMSQRERVSTPVGDAVENMNVRQATAKKAVPADVLQFAQEYRTMSSAQVKTLLSPGLNPLGPAAAAENKRLFDAACACGAI
jgi:hypothetical protein